MKTSIRNALAGLAILACGVLLHSQQTSAPQTVRLTLAQAEQLALQHNPNISIARLLELAQAQVTRETRSAELPTVTTDLTAVDSHDDSRLTAGELNNPTVYQRAAGGLRVSQLISDFGRTHHLVSSARASQQAQFEDQRATQQDITLAVDQAYYQALTAQAVLQVAQETVAARQTTVDQISALTRAKLKSTLDLSFAKVQLSQAQLLLLDARNSTQAANVNLNALLGSESDTLYDLVDPTPKNPQPAPDDVEGMVRLAFRARPDLAALNDNSTAAQEYSKAEHDLWHPTVSALAAVGGTPVRADQIQSSWYGAAGANVSIPVFNGFLFSARAHAADFEASAAQERVRDLREGIARDVRDAVLTAQTAFDRIGVSQQLLNEAKLSLDLAQTRYQIGLSGIVELSQAQLAETQAQIAYANARYAYQTALAVVRYQTGQ
jgi:outer membrane protein